jgi:hypothetical protein
MIQREVDGEERNNKVKKEDEKDEENKNKKR